MVSQYVRIFWLQYVFQSKFEMNRSNSNLLIGRLNIPADIKGLFDPEIYFANNVNFFFLLKLKSSGNTY